MAVEHDRRSRDPLFIFILLFLLFSFHYSPSPSIPSTATWHGTCVSSTRLAFLSMSDSLRRPARPRIVGSAGRVFSACWVFLLICGVLCAVYRWTPRRKNRVLDFCLFFFFLRCARRRVLTGNFRVGRVSAVCLQVLGNAGFRLVSEVPSRVRRGRFGDLEI